jgi:putative endonuclease
VAARRKAHGRGRGAAYTRARRPVELLFREASLTRSQALVREWEIKQLPRPRKEKLIAAYRAALALSSAQTFS